ncbi:MAG: AsmA-like C-terminal domain-containing protein [Rhizobiaceae bacterium]
MARSVGWLFAAIALVFVGAFGWLFFFGFSSAQFTSAAEGLIRSAGGPTIQANLESAKLALDSTGNLAFRGSHLSLVSADGSGITGRIDDIKIGLGTLSLLTGKPEIVHLEVDGASIELPALSGAGLFDVFKLADGRYSPATAPTAAASLIKVLGTELSKRKTTGISLRNIRFMRAGSTASMPSFPSLELERLDDDSFGFSGRVAVAEQQLPFEGMANAAGSFRLQVNGYTIGQPAPDGVVTGGRFKTGASADIVIAGDAVTQGNRLKGEIRLNEFAWTSRRDIRYAGRGLVAFELRDGLDKIEILPSSLDLGANGLRFTGAVGLNASPAGDGPAYRFELVSNESRLQPSDSTERGVDVAFRILGNMSKDFKSLEFSDMNARTLGGDIIGQGSMRFLTGSPEMVFGIRIPSMRVTDAKQFWPGMIAFGARKWVLEHVYGGTLFDSRIDVTFKSGYFNPLPEGTVRPALTVDDLTADFNIRGARFDVIGDLPPVRDADGSVSVRGDDTVVTISQGAAYLENGDTATVSSGTLSIPYTPGRPTVANLEIDVAGSVRTIADLANREPLNALDKAPVVAADLSGQGKARIATSFALRKAADSPETVWKASVDFENLAIAKDFNGQKLTDAKGRLDVDQSTAVFEATGNLNGIPADIKVSEPIGGSGGKREVSAKMRLDDNARNLIAPGLKDIVKGVVGVEVEASPDGSQLIKADLKSATLNLPWAGWSKGSGVPATAILRVTRKGNAISISDFDLKGATFQMTGSMDLAGGSLIKADFSTVRLNRGDDAAVTIARGKGGLDVTVNAKSLDLRSLIKRILSNFEDAAAATGGETVRLKATIGSASGFGSQTLLGVRASYTGKGSRVLAFKANAETENGGSVTVENSENDGRKSVRIKTSDGGAVLRFLDYYDKMRGGQINIALSENDGVLSGEVDAQNFTIVGEPRLKSLVGSPVTKDGQSVAKAGKINASAVKFQRGTSTIQKGKGFLRLANGILRSDQIGLSYEGTLYDQKGRIDMTGTFLPAYGLNRIFGEIPLIGEILGNGRDKGLIGITFKLTGAAKAPQLTVNPISLVAPGIFRKIFEFQ